MPSGVYQRPGAEALIERNIFPEPNSGCWLWAGQLNAAGYGTLSVDRKRVSAHRLSYETFVGEISEETLDHQCRTLSCVNPAHLRPMSRAENSRLACLHRPKKMFCKYGHPLFGDNIRIEKGTWGGTFRKCLTCYRATKKRIMAKKKKERAADILLEYSLSEGRRNALLRIADRADEWSTPVMIGATQRSPMSTFLRFLCEQGLVESQVRLTARQGAELKRPPREYRITDLGKRYLREYLIRG